MVMEAWTVNIMTQFLCQNSGANSISSQHYSSSLKLPPWKDLASSPVQNEKETIPLFSLFVILWLGKWPAQG